MEKSKRYDEHWYVFLKGAIMSNIKEQRLKDLDYAFIHGQVVFAWTSGLITQEQANELSDMLPDY